MKISAKSLKGFTLIEASLTTVIIGVGVVAMLELLAAGTRVNVEGTEKTTAVNLARNVRERIINLPFAQLPALDGTTYTTPIDSRGQPLTDFTGWTQAVAVRSVDPDRLTSNLSAADPDALRLSVTVSHNGEQLCNLEWYAFDGTP